MRPIFTLMILDVTVLPIGFLKVCLARNVAWSIGAALGTASTELNKVKA